MRVPFWVPNIVRHPINDLNLENYPYVDYNKDFRCPDKRWKYVYRIFSQAAELYLSRKESDLRYE